MVFVSAFFAVCASCINISSGFKVWLLYWCGFQSENEVDYTVSNYRITNMKLTEECANYLTLQLG